MHGLSPVQEHPYSDRYRKDSSKRIGTSDSDDTVEFLRPPGMPKQQIASYPPRGPLIESASGQEMWHFVSGNVNKFNNNTNQASEPARPSLPPLPPPEESPKESRQLTRPSASAMEMKHFGKHNPNSRNGALATLASKDGSETTGVPAILLPPAQSASRQEMRHFNPPKLNRSDGWGRDGNSSLGSKRW